MQLELTGQHILITGGSKGIGWACALGFLQEGARVSLVSRSAAHLASAVAQLQAALADAEQPTALSAPSAPAAPLSRVHTFAADMCDPASALRALDAAEAHFGPVDVLVNSAGAARRTPVDELTPDAWQAAMQAKYFSTIHMMDPCVKRMGARGRGAIVNVVGSGGRVASPWHLPGGAANAALMLVSAGLAAAYGPRGVRVNAVNPGLTLTERLQEGLLVEARVNGSTPEEALHKAASRIPLGRLAEPQEIANAVVFLASAKASYITGVVLAMDGAVVPMGM